MRLAKLCTTLAAALVVASGYAQTGVDNMPVERLQAIGEARAAALSADLKLQANLPAYVIDSHRWKVGSTVNVAFLGGSTELHQAIEKLANEWTQYANIKFDFGYNPATGKYREWSRADKTYAARVRISFDQTGHYSAVGTESVDSKRFPPHMESMNFSDFNMQYPNAMPDDWGGIVRHEFGHALGLWHEHQKPFCTGEIRWVDEGSKQSAYTYYLNNLRWPTSYTDSNLKPPISVDDRFGKADSVNLTSLLIYKLPPEILIKGTASPCYTKTLPTTFSDLDKEAIALVYPFDKSKAVPVDPSKVTAVLAAVARSDILSISDRIAFSSKVESRTIADRPKVYVQMPSATAEVAAKEIRTRLKIDGFIAPEIENVGVERSPNRLEVRYFKKADQGSAEAVAASVANASDVASAPLVKYIKGYETKSIRPALEVWLPKSSR